MSASTNPGDSGSRVAKPLVSIVTPSYNSGSFLEQTILSVLRQTYPNIEYIIVDGGSTDETESIVNRYRSRVRFLQEPDEGPAQAINRGMKLAGGSIVTWLGADDLYPSDAVAEAVRAFENHPDAGIVYGKGTWIDRQGKFLGFYPTLPFEKRMLQKECIICQPAAFLSKSVWDRVGGLREHLRSAFDYDLWMRCVTERFVYLPENLAFSRMHRNNLSIGKRSLVFEEAMQIQREHFGYIHPQWVFGYACYRKDGADQFFEPLKPSALLYLASLVEGLRINPTKPVRYVVDWLRPILHTMRTGWKSRAA